MNSYMEVLGAILATTVVVGGVIAVIAFVFVILDEFL